MKTVNEAIDPRKVNEEIDRLRTSIIAVTAAEKNILKNKVEKLSFLRREAQQQADAQAAALEYRIQAMQEDFKLRLAALHHVAKTRTARVEQAYKSSKTALAQRTQHIKDQQIGRVQTDLMQRRQMRKADLDQAASAHEALLQTLAEDRSKRLAIRKHVLSSLRTFKPLIPSWLNHFKSEATEEDTFEKTRTQLLETLAAADEVAGAAAKLPMAGFFRFVPLSLLITVILAAHLWLGLRNGGGGLPSVMPSLLISEAALLVVWGIALFTSLKVIRHAARLLGDARALEAHAVRQSDERLASFKKGIKDVEAEEGESLGETLREAGVEWRSRISKGQKDLDERLNRLPARMERHYGIRFERLEEERTAGIDRLRADSADQTSAFVAQQDLKKAVIEEESSTEISKLAQTWDATAVLAWDHLIDMGRASLSSNPQWNHENCHTWKPPETAPDALRIGHVPVNTEKLAGGLPSSASLRLPDSGNFLAPLALGFPHQASLMIETDGSDDGAAARALQATALRIIASYPPGRASFLFIDPVGLGKDFAGLMHLADYEETLITSRIWTQTTHIEERLAEINEHIEKLIQMYLRDEYDDIHAYNAQAGTIAEKDRFLVIAGFPAAFSDTAAKRLRSIASSGARCGVHLLIQRDMRQPSPDSALDDELRRTCLRILLKNGVFHLPDAPKGADTLQFDPPPFPEDSVELVHRIGRASIDSSRVQVPFSQIAPPQGEEWRLDTTEELRVPIGRTGAKKLQMLAIGKGTRQHMLVAGKTGSGKSTLFHVIITNLARWASPEQVEFYLVDFKKGVEFKCYGVKHLPHARVVAIESDREFALSVLQKVDAELKRRGELFRKAGAQDVPGFKRSAGAGSMPRTLLLIDEFQEFFTEDDSVAQEASLLLDRIVRQGRAFGIHVILGSQTLGGAYTLARATLGQMVIRVALQCNEADAHLIMDDDNPAPRLLTRPGEGIYNDQAGTLAANSPFQIVWLPENERDAVLDDVLLRAKSVSGIPQAPIVFEGNAPADIRDNEAMQLLLRERPATRPKKAHAWLGAPNSIKGHTEAAFQRQSGSHLLIVGQSAERSLSMLTVTITALALQFPTGQAEFIVLDPHASEEKGWYHKLAALLPNKVRIGGTDEVSALMTSLAADLTARGSTSGRDAPEVFLIIHDLQRFKALKPDDEFRFSLDDDGAPAIPSKVFADLLGEGGPCGMHVIVSTDSWSNVSRWIPRKLMAEFEMRVLFQMSANDSANLIDSPAASTLGLHRAMFFNEHLGTIETFRPYALPDDSWIENLANAAEKNI